MSDSPSSVLAIEFKGSNFRGEILSALIDLVQNGTVRVIDAIAVKRDDKGKVTALEINELGVTDMHIFDPLNAEITGLLTYEDIQDIGSHLDNNTAAGVLVLEHIWATKLAQGIVRANGKVVMNQLIMPDVLQENMAAMEAVK